MPFPVRMRFPLALCAAGTLLAAPNAHAQRLVAQRAPYVVRLSAPNDEAAVPAVLRQPVSIHLKRVTLERALQAVAASGLELTYSGAVVPLQRTVSVDVTDASALDVLRQLLRDVDVELWVTAEGRVALVPSARAARTANAMSGIVTGRVTAGEGGAPVSDATITVSGTRLGARTNADGRYTIAAVPEGARLLYAQRIGYAPDSQTVTVGTGQTTTADFVLHARAVQLNDVVTIGYGTTTRRDLTGSITSVSAEQIASAPVQSVDQALLGRAPGVQVVSSSGQPGAAALVRIRGGNSINAGNDPLYVVDGVPVLGSPNGANTGTLTSQSQSGLNPLAAINPGDIESIDVLKDASATSIYGARAANGVVLITTKHGRPGTNAVTFGAYYGTQQVRHTLPVLDATQFATLVNSAYTNAGQTAPYTASQIASLGSGTNWQDEIFRTAPVQNYDLAFSGGDRDTKYYVSGSLLKNEGVVIGTSLNRGSVRLNLDQQLSSRFRIGNRFTFSHSEGQVMPNGGAGQEVPSVVLNALTAPPTIPVRTATGDYYDAVNPLTGRPFSNPVASALLIQNQEKQNRGIGNVFGEYDLTRSLTLRSTFGVDYLSSIQNFYSPSNTLPGRTYGGYGSRGEAAVTNWLNENTVDWRHGFGRIGDLDLLGGVTLQRVNTETVSGTGYGFLTDNLGVNGLNTANTFAGVYTGFPHSSLLSYFSRANWNVADRYLFTVTGRVDGSSKFGQGNRYAFFPSAAFAWRLSDEGFVKSLGLFDDLKLRTSYGRTGNQEIGNYASLATLGSTIYVFGGSRGVGFAPNSLANPDLKWETTDQFDGGIDMAVMQRRVSLTADVYDKRTHDLLLYVPVPATSGFGTSLQNIGSVRNRGLELGLNTVNLTGPLSWESSFNIAWNRNKVLNLGPNTTQIIAPVGVGSGANQNPTLLRVGEATNTFYGWRYDKTVNGQPTYKDLNGDGAITAADETIIGSAQPKYTGGLNNHVAYRGLDLSVFLQWSVGNKIYNINRALLTSAAGNANQLADVTGSGAGLITPKIGNTFDSRPSDLFVENGSYLRGKNVRLGYTIPGAWVRSAGVRNVSALQVYVSAQNFFTNTKYTGFDPEVSEYATSNLAQGIDFGTFPQTRQFTVGVTAGF